MTAFMNMMRRAVITIGLTLIVSFVSICVMFAVLVQVIGGAGSISANMAGSTSASPHLGVEGERNVCWTRP